MIAIAYYKFRVKSPKSHGSLTALAFSHCRLKLIAVGFMVFQFLLMSHGLKKHNSFRILGEKFKLIWLLAPNFLQCI